MKKILIVCLLFFVLFNIDVVNAEEVLLQGGNTYAKIVCGDTDVPYIAAQVTTTVINILKIVTPIIIIIFGMIDLVKAVVAQKEDDIKKGSRTFLKRVLLGAFVFLVFVFVEVIIGLVAPKNENTNMWNCVDCFVNGNCSSIMK